tara:strand:+ start:579 stop:1745 length:1167 start_codon:yes stop_codon:yes gene_type:complete
MSEEKEDLFEGLQIMSPEELNAVVESDENSEEGEKETTPNDESEGLFKPVESEEGEGAYENTKNQTDSKTTTSNERSEEIYKGLIKELVESNIITAAEADKLDELEGSLDTIKDLMNKTVQTNFKAAEEQWKENMPAAKKRFLEIEDAFDETDQAIMMAQRLEFFDNVDEESIKSDENLQKEIYYDLLKSKNFSDEQAVEAIQDAIEVKKLESKALKAIPELKNQANAVVTQAKEYKAAKTKQEVAEQNKAFESLIANIDNRQSFVEGMSLNKISKEKIKQNILNPVYKDKKTGTEYNSLMYKQTRNPVEFEMLINYYDTLGLFNLDKAGKFKPDISKLKQVAKTKAINDLDKIIAKEDRNVGRNTSVETSEKTGNILDMLERSMKKR